MLVLSRYKDQSIYIGDDIVVTIVDVRGDRIRLGIDAPPDVPVHRQEIYEAIKRENAGDRSSRRMAHVGAGADAESDRVVMAGGADYELKLR